MFKIANFFKYLKMSQPENFQEVIKFVATSLRSRQYAIRGTASLVLQGIQMNVDDIDIICDKETAIECNEIWKKYTLEKVEFSKSNEFKSFYGKFRYKGVLIEIMGNWQIKKKSDDWSEVYDGKKGRVIEVEESEVCVTTIKQELRMFSQMGRWNAYQKIKRQFEKQESGQERMFAK